MWHGDLSTSCSVALCTTTSIKERGFNHYMTVYEKRNWLAFASPATSISWASPTWCEISGRMNCLGYVITLPKWWQHLQLQVSFVVSTFSHVRSNSFPFAMVTSTCRTCLKPSFWLLHWQGDDLGLVGRDGRVRRVGRVCRKRRSLHEARWGDQWIPGSTVCQCIIW